MQEGGCPEYTGDTHPASWRNHSTFNNFQDSVGLTIKIGCHDSVIRSTYRAWYKPVILLTASWYT